MGRGGILAWVLGGLALAAATTAMAAPERPGERFHVRVEDLPPPNASPALARPSRKVARPAGAVPQVPGGFTVTLFAEGLGHPRNLMVAPNGDVLLAQSRPGEVTLLRDADGDGAAEVVETFADGFNTPYGLALRDGHLYVADLHGVWRLPYREGAIRADGKPEPITKPGAIGSTSGHSTRSLAFAPDGRRFYVGIGSAGNIGEEAAPRATVQEFAADGTHLGTVAAGLRNPVGLAFRPGTDELWTVVNERDGLGDDLVPDYLTRLRRGGFYGWPYSYLGASPQPGLAGRRPDLVRQAIVPDVLFQSHSAPLGLAFYTGRQFPEDYRDDAFVALHGSWNSGTPTGYKVVRVPFENGRPTGGYENFATGFRLPGEANERAEVWGRPAAVAVAGDGSLLIADDVGGTIWRVSYRGA